MSADAQITVKSRDAKPGHAFEVRVREGKGETRHEVTVSEKDLARFGGGGDPAALVEESFRFLLEREPKESILGRFELNVIARYFPEYPDEIARRLKGV
ncbi:MAG: hypothetical protein Q8R92_08605 [Deltaproteobacteria bacterium]|nr:hypothetical protein [Deltaproteobacteria bacterium]